MCHRCCPKKTKKKKKKKNPNYNFFAINTATCAFPPLASAVSVMAAPGPACLMGLPEPPLSSFVLKEKQKGWELLGSFPCNSNV